MVKNLSEDQGLWEALLPDEITAEFPAPLGSLGSPLTYQEFPDNYLFTKRQQQRKGQTIPCRQRDLRANQKLLQLSTVQNIFKLLIN